MALGVLSRIAIIKLILIYAVNQLYSSAIAADAPCSCSSTAPGCPGVTPALQQQLVDQLGFCTARSIQLKQQLLRQQYHRPLVITLAGSSSMWQLLVCAVLLVLCLLSIAQAASSKRQRASLQQALQQQCNTSRALYSSRRQLQQQLYQQQQRHAAWSASLQHMQWLVAERATALVAQEALVSKALGVPSMLAGTTDTSHGADQPTSIVLADESAGQNKADKAEQQTVIPQESEQEGVQGSAAAAGTAAAAAPGDDSASKDDVSIIQQGLDTLHAYLHACNKAKLVGLEHLQQSLQQQYRNVQGSLQQQQQQQHQEKQQQQQQQQQQEAAQQLAGLPEGAAGDGQLNDDTGQQQQRIRAVDAAAGSVPAHTEARLQDSPFMWEHPPSASAKHQPAAAHVTAPGQALDGIVRKLHFSGTNAVADSRAADDVAAAPAAAAGGAGGVGSAGTGEGDAAGVVAEPVLSHGIGKQEQGLLARLLLSCFQPSSTKEVLSS